MSVTQEHHVTIPCPCTPDCPDRRALCFSACKPYLEYEKSRNAGYKVRKEQKRATDDAYAGIKKAISKARRERLAHGKRR